MSQNVEIIFIKDSSDYKRPPHEVIQELVNGNRYIESYVVPHTEICPLTDFPILAQYSKETQAKIPTIRPKDAKIIKWKLSDNQLFDFIGVLKSGRYYLAHKFTHELTTEKISHWFIRYHDKESIPDFIFKFLKENNLTYSIIDNH